MFSPRFFPASKRRESKLPAGAGRFGGRLGEVSHGQVRGAVPAGALCAQIAGDHECTTKCSWASIEVYWGYVRKF